ncbi:molybdopterin-dependent oxidoreductase [Chitinimonas sp. BJYL2]|uniref:molybdopterin-dependent oxidoreductase n=1 Tax=Chitinimonas sp. BJYL2 TaxID=2976696 RepID=UPI0022B342DF|nr:molybdopterin-dependent oxidoreductase [Chitinimonas sp. BJYL2]
MNKRQFLQTSALGLAATSLPVAAAGRRTPGPVLLTLTGQIGKSNRGAFDPAFDQMLGKHKANFSKAYTFDYAALAALPAITIKPTLEYDGKVHTLSGPLLTHVLAMAGVKDGNPRILLQALDGYTVAPTLDEIRNYRFIIATHRDGVALPLGGIGPLWAVYDADRYPDMAAKPLKERFALCPWGIYHINVQAA